MHEVIEFVGRHSVFAEPGARFVPLSEVNTSPNNREDESPWVQDEALGQISPASYRVLHVDPSKGLILLQATFAKCPEVRRDVKNKKMEYILVDSRTKNFSRASCGFDDNVNFHDVRPGELIWVYDLQLGLSVADWEKVRFGIVENPDSVISVVRCARWFASLICFANRPIDSVYCSIDFFKAQVKYALDLAEEDLEADVGPRQQRSTENGRPPVVKPEPEPVPRPIQRTPVAQAEPRRFPVMPKLEDPKPSVAEQPERVPSPPADRSSRTNPQREPAEGSSHSSEHSSASSGPSFSSARGSNDSDDRRTEQKRFASNAETAPLLPRSSQACSPKMAPSTSSVPSASTVPKVTKAPAAKFTIVQKKKPIFEAKPTRSPIQVPVEPPTQEPIAPPAQKKPSEPEIDEDELLNRDIFGLGGDELDAEEQRDLPNFYMPDNKKEDFLTQLQNVDFEQFRYTSEMFFREKPKTRPPLRNVELRERDPLAVNFRAGDSLFGNQFFPIPYTYRVIAVLGNRQQLVLEALFTNLFWFGGYDAYKVQFLVLDMASYEGPEFDTLGFNVYDSAVNDIVCVYDLLPYRGPQPDSSAFERRAYGRSDSYPCHVTFKAYAHCFCKLSIFKTLYGMVNNENTIITGIDEPVNVDKQKDIGISIGDHLYQGDMFRIDVIQKGIFNKIADHKDAIRAGGMLTYATESGPQKMAVVAGKKLNNIVESYETPFKPEVMKEYKLDVIEALDRQAAAFALGKYGEEMSARIELLGKAYPVQLTFDKRDQFSGTLKFVDIEGVLPDQSLKEEPELKIYIPEVGSFGIQIYNRQRAEKCKFAVMYISKDFVSKNFEEINRRNRSPDNSHQNSDYLKATAMDKSPNADPAIQFLCNGGFARSMKRQALEAASSANPDAWSSYQLIFDALRTGELKRSYETDDYADNLQLDPYMRFAASAEKKTIRLDDQQEEIVKYIACMKEWPAITVINACAGAGKSLCSVAVIRQTAKDDPNSIQLVCSAANRAVDNLAESLASLGENDVRAIRIFSSRQRAKLNFEEPRHGFNAVVERIKKEAFHYSLTEDEVLLLEDYITAYKKLGKTAANPRGREDFDCIDEQKRIMKNLLGVVCDLVMRRYRPHVILTTIDFFISQSLSKYGNTLCRQKFARVLIDEASQLEEARFSLLLNRNFSTKQFVVVGDPMQLPPYFPTTYDQNLKSLFGRPTLELLHHHNTGDVPTVELTYNYRMQPTLLAMTSEGFYDGRLTSMDGPWKSKEPKWRFFEGQEPLLIASVDGEQQNEGTSLVNWNEARQAVNLVRSAIDDGVQESEIGVICLYKSQQLLVIKELKKVQIWNVEVATVDSYQGREKDYIILLTTRSIFSAGGFFYDLKRANVATSRAILGMVVLCNEVAVRGYAPWDKLINFCLRKGLYAKNFYIE